MRIFRWLGGLFAALALLVVAVSIIGFFVVQHYAADLPDHRQLATYEPPVTTRVYTGDGRLLAEYATEKRVFVPIDAIPQRVIDAFLSAEDKNFFQHRGVDIAGIARAVLTNVQNYGTDRRPMGASTITQQVAKNFLLSNELSFDRKIKEAILAYRLDSTFSKQRILELYLNEIYLGRGSYGVAAAALNYFGKSLDELTAAEAAFLAALPKAPNNYDPVKQPDVARARRDWVIQRMEEDGHLTAQEAADARAHPLVTKVREGSELAQVDYFAEEVRRDLIKRYGEKALYTGGLTVHSTIDPALQKLAEQTLQRGLERYDRQHGWRGPITSIAVGNAVPTDWRQRLAHVPPAPGLLDRKQAVVLQVGAGDARIGFADGTTGRIPFSDMRWARPNHDGRIGGAPAKPADVLKPGDVVMVDPTGTAGAFALKQAPMVEGALVALDPQTGRVLAMAGGYDYKRSVFNRVTQALRQPGSAFKPIVYLCALENGYTPRSVIMDAPFSVPQGPGLPRWSPSNYSDRYYGPTNLRTALEQSRNVVTARLAYEIGMKKVADCAQRLGVMDHMPPLLSYSLGAGETTLLRLATGYGVLVNGGLHIEPSVIDRVQDRYGKIIWRQDTRPCPRCKTEEWDNQRMPRIPDNRERATDPQSAYQMVSMLEGVVQRGTGTAVKAVGKPLAGKTGTSTDAKDVWFVGFSPDLVAGVFVGYDEPQSLGGGVTGGELAAPMFRDFMKEALKDQPAIPFRIPSGLKLVRMNAPSARKGGPSEMILEAFKPGTTPAEKPVAAIGPRPPKPKDAPASKPAVGNEISTGTGGLY